MKRTGAGFEPVRQRLAAEFGCDPEELAITRNASEALEIAQLGLDLNPGDEVLSLARARGLTTIVDDAHAFAHFPFSAKDFDGDYYGTSLHKWLLARVGTGSCT